MQLATLLLSFSPPRPQKPAFATPLSLAVTPPSRTARHTRRLAVTALSADHHHAAPPPTARDRPLKPARKRIRSRNNRTGPANAKCMRIQPDPVAAFTVPHGDLHTLATTAAAKGGGGGATMMVASTAERSGGGGGGGGDITAGGGSRARSRKPKLGRKMRNGRARALTKLDPPQSPLTVPKTSDLRPESCPALVLNADFSPLSYMPLSLWPWQEVVKAVFLDRVTVVATYDVGVRSPSMLFPLPSVVSLKQYQPMAAKKPAFTRFNVFLRDAFSCQYCGRRYPTHELTFDHVVPRCAGGRTNWTNVVTACVSCNHAKGRHLLKELRGFKLLRKPVPPSNPELQRNARKFPPQYLHESWRDYVYWSQSMEEN